jgi:curved DNA-binding protein
MSVEFRDYYGILGVSRTATEEEIKKAFRKLARQYHPDVAKDKKSAEARFKEINEAYEVLGDPEKRRRYDQLGAGWRPGAEFRPPPGFEQPGRRGSAPGGREFEFHFGGTGFSEFFERFFGGGRFAGFDPFGEGLVEEDRFRSKSQDRGQRGSDVEGDVLVTLREVLRGSVRDISLRRLSPVTGQRDTHTIRVRIPPGVQEGQRIRVAGRGGEGMGQGRPGDLYLRVLLAKHPDFRVMGTNLYYDLDLAAWEAVLGATVAVPTLEGGVTVRIPPGTGAGQQLRVRGHGLPRGQGQPRGDLLVMVQIQVPTKVNAEQRGLWEQLAKHSTFNPRKAS